VLQDAIDEQVEKKTEKASTALQAAAERRGWTRERFLNVQVKLRILVSLIQILSQLGVVFQIPYPPIYTDMVEWLGVFSVAHGALTRESLFCGAP
jgi:hypothetical protein